VLSFLISISVVYNDYPTNQFGIDDIRLATRVVIQNATPFINHQRRVNKNSGKTPRLLAKKRSQKILGSITNSQASRLNNIRLGNTVDASKEFQRNLHTRFAIRMSNTGSCVQKILIQPSVHA